MFKVGDKVRATMNCSSAIMGNIYVVEEGKDNGNGKLWINSIKSAGGCHHWQSWELVESSSPKKSMAEGPLYNSATNEKAEAAKK